MGGRDQYKEILQELKKEFEAFRQDYQSEKHDHSADNKVCKQYQVVKSNLIFCIIENSKKLS